MKNNYFKSWNLPIGRTMKKARGMLLLCTLLLINAHAWGWNPVYFIGDPTNNWSSNKTNYVISNNADEGSAYFYFAQNNCFAVYITYYNEQAGPGDDKSEMNVGAVGAQRFYIWGDGENNHAAKYVGNSGIVEVHAKQKDNGDDQPWIWLTRPTVYIRHNWNNDSESNQAMTDNNDGTYTYTGKFSNSAKTTLAGPTSSGTSSGSAIFKKWTSPTLVGSPVNGDKCIFEFNASGYKGFGGATSNTGTMTITRLYSITYDDNDATSGSVPTGVTDRKWNVTTTIADNTGSLVKTGCVFVGWNTSADGSGTFYLPGSSFSPSVVSTTLYAQWLTIHEPGLYEKAALSGGYGQTLATSGGRDYEVYQYASSSGIYVYAGTSTTSATAANCMLKYTTSGSGSSARKGWMLHSGGVYNTSSFSTYSEEFQTNAIHLNVVAGNMHIIAVTGYDQFSLYGKDKTSSTAEMKIYINGTEKTLNDAKNFKIGRWDLDPSTTYIIRITANGTGSNASRDAGFSLRIPTEECDATAPGAISKGSLSACSLPLTAYGSPASNNTWYWQESSTGTDKTGTSGATKNVTSTGTYYVRSYYSTDNCWSDAQSIEVTASDLTPAAPTALAKSSVTAKGVTLTVTDAANTNDYEFYVSTSSSTPSSGTTATHSVTSAKSLTITDLYAGTTFYAWARAKCGSYKSAWTALTGNTFTTSQVTASYTLSNVNKSSGATSGIGGSNYSAVFAGATDYALPSTITVTIGGNAATSGTDYTWNQGTGTLSITKEKITGNIAATISSAAAAPSSVDISGDYVFYPGEDVELTATPTGGNGPTTYQWQKKINSVWTDITLVENSTAQSATLVYEDATTSNAGNYRCVVTKGGTQSLASDQFDLKYLWLYTYYDDKSDHGNVAFERVDATHARVTVSLSNGDYTYYFKVTDGHNNWYGNDGTMTSSNHSGWTMNVNNHCGLTTGKAGSYVFNLDYSPGVGTSMTMTVDYPSADQAADKVIYLDNSVLEWTGSSIYYRIGHNSYNDKTQMTLVPGTANLYTVTTSAWSGFAAWHIANAAGQSGAYSIYDTKSGTAITAATRYNGDAVTNSAVTVTPGTDHSTSGDALNNNCEFYTYSITSGMKTDNVAISPYSNGTITVNYTNTSGSAATLTSGNADLPHTVILTSITAVANTGYKASAITINGGDYSANYVVTGATTVAASFSAKQSAITFDKNGGTGGATGTTGTYGSAMTTVTVPKRLGYTFDGYWDAETDNDGSGTKYYNADGTSARNWDKDTESATTLYAKWVEVECPSAGSGETVFKFVPVTSSTAYVASSSGAELTTSDYLTTLENGHVLAYGSSSSNVVMTDKGVKLASSTGYLKLEFDCALAAGDVVKWKAYANSINLCNSTTFNLSNDLTLAKSQDDYSTVTITSAMEGKSTLYILYNSGVAHVMYFEIIRPEGYSVTYKANGGTGSDVARIDATAASLATVGFTRAGYDFDGWNTASEGGGDAYDVGDEITEAVTLYAQWSCVTPTIGTDLSTSEVDYTQGASASALTIAATANGDGGNGTVSYQWYSNTANSTTTPTPATLTGQTSASYTPSTASIGTTYYFCIATNSSSGCSTTKTSKIAKIVVSEAPCFEITNAGKNGSSWPKSNGNTIANSDIDGTITGGTVTYTGSGSLTGNDTYGIIFDNDNDELTISLSGSHALDVGSVITIVQHGNSSTSKETGFKISGNSMSPATCNNGSTAYKEMTQTYTVSASDGVEGSNSFTIKWTGTNQVYLYSMTITGCITCTTFNPTLNYDKTTLWVNDGDIATPTLDKKTSTGSVTYSSSNTDIATVNESTGVVTAVAGGNVTITASIASDGTHCARTATCDLTIKQAACGWNEIANAVLTAKNSATTSNATALYQNMSNSSAPYKLDKTLPSYFGLRLSSGNFQVGDSIIFKVKIGDMDINGGSTYPVAFYHTTDTSSYTTSNLIYTSGAQTKGADNVYIRFAVTQAMKDAGLTNTILIIRSGRVKQNHSMYEVRIKRFTCTECLGFVPSSSSEDWNTLSNWYGSSGPAAALPTASDRVHIYKPATVDGVTALASEIILYTDEPNTGKLTIADDGVLKVAGTIQAYNNATSTKATTVNDVVIECSKTSQGALIFDQPSSGSLQTKGTVNFYTRSYRDGTSKKLQWQYVGYPFISGTDEDYDGYYINKYSETQGKWIVMRDQGDRSIAAWEGLAIAGDGEGGAQLQGTFAPTTNQSITLSKTTGKGGGENLVGNSWTAPIQLADMSASDFGDATATVYIFNTGRFKNDESEGAGIDTEGTTGHTVGQWMTIPISSAASGVWAGMKVIPAFQAFEVITSSATTLSLNYANHVRSASNTMNAELHAPARRGVKASEVDGYRIRVADSLTQTDMYLFEDISFTTGFDNGWEGYYMPCDGRSAQLYVQTTLGKMAVAALPDLEGTLLGFKPGKSSEYTFSFGTNAGGYYLNDLKTQTSTLIEEGETYTFTWENGDSVNRFMISATPFAGMPSGLDEISGKTDKVQKVVYKDHVYIIRGGRIFDAVGGLVK